MDDEPFQVELTPEFRPWRRGMEFFPCEEAPIAPLVAELGFIPDKQRWGSPFRRGLFQVPRDDFARIYRALRVDGAAIPRARSA